MACPPPAATPLATPPGPPGRLRCRCEGTSPASYGSWWCRPAPAAARPAGAGRSCDLGRAAREALDEGQDLQHRDHLAATDVEGLAAGAVVHGGHRGRHAVVNEGVAPGLVPVAVDRDGLAPEHAVNELVIAHVRPLAGAVDAEVAQNGEGHVEAPGVGAHQVLGGQLGDAVRRHGRGGPALVARRVPAVDRGRGDVDEMGAAPFPQGLQQPLRSQHVAAEVVVELRPRAHQAAHGRQVEDHVGAVQNGRELVVAQVGRHEAKGVVLVGGGQVALLHGPRIVVREAVHALHFVAIRQQAIHEVAADEAGRPGDHAREGPVGGLGVRHTVDYSSAVRGAAPAGRGF